MSTIPIFFARSFLSQPYALLPLLPRVILTALSYLSVFVFAFGLIRMMRQGTKDARGTRSSPSGPCRGMCSSARGSVSPPTKPRDCG